MLDVDGVLADFPNEVLRFCNIYGRATDAPHYRLEDVRQHDILEALGLEHLQQRLDTWCADSDMCRHLPVYPGAQDFVEKLRSFADLVVVTSRYKKVPNWTSARDAWLAEHFGIDADDVVSAKRKELVPGEILIDDKTTNLVAWGSEWPAGMAVAFDQPWNQDWSGIRVRGHGEAAESVRNYWEGWNAASGGTP